ncbi:hypothetical protein T492DRAFT_835326 [Pavlovales sp. CCMP2436]|nr:hypothetical protein T492DRAFT_835326 [Pavlovales sp. CCMP2436]
MTTIATAALALGVGVEHMRPRLPPALFHEDAAQRSRAAMVGGGVLGVAALMFPARVAPFTALVQQVTPLGTYSRFWAALALAQLYVWSAENVHPMFLGKS